LNYSPSGAGTYRYISPSFDTSKVHDLTLSFLHLLSDYAGNSNLYTLAVQISGDGTNWTSLWSTTTSASIPATQVNINLPYTVGMSPTTYLAIAFIGNNFDIKYWKVDDIVLSYTNTLGSGTWSVGTHYPVGNVIVPAGRTFTLNGGTTLNFDYAAILEVSGSLRALGDFGYPVSFSSMPGSSWGGLQIANTGSLRIPP